MPATKSPRVVCPHCEKSVGLRNGALARHGYQSTGRYSAHAVSCPCTGCTPEEAKIRALVEAKNEREWLDSDDAVSMFARRGTSYIEWLRKNADGRIARLA